jgi:multisubunit Na+/H+ antiporter MnhE subunit
MGGEGGAVSRALAIVLLLWNFLKGALSSGLITARIIVRRPGVTRPGFARLSYGNLSDRAANLLGALITLTPGTTAVDIDLERREILLHLLDLDQKEATLAAIEQDFLVPMRALVGGGR